MASDMEDYLRDAFTDEDADIPPVEIGFVRVILPTDVYTCLACGALVADPHLERHAQSHGGVAGEMPVGLGLGS